MCGYDIVLCIGDGYPAPPLRWNNVFVILLHHAIFPNEGHNSKSKNQTINYRHLELTMNSFLTTEKKSSKDFDGF